MAGAYLEVIEMGFRWSARRKLPGERYSFQFAGETPFTMRSHAEQPILGASSAQQHAPTAALSNLTSGYLTLVLRQIMGASPMHPCVRLSRDMKRELALVVAALLISMPGVSQISFSSAHERRFELPKPAFILHDGKLHSQKAYTAFGPNRSFAVYAGTSVIQVSSLSFSADGRFLAVGSTPGIVDVWDVGARRKVRAFRGGTSVALSADGRWLAKDGNGIELVDMRSGKVERTIPWPNDSDHTVETLSFDPAGRWLLVATNGLDLKAFDVTTGSLLATLTNTRRGVFSSDGSLVVGGDYRHLVTWNTENWQVVRDLPNGPDYVTTVAVNSAKDMEIIGGPNSARLLKVATGEELAKIGEGYTNFASFIRAGSKILTFSGTGFAIWNSDGKLECFTPANGYDEMAVSPDDRWLAAAPDKQLTDVAIWNLKDVLAACTSATESRPGRSK